MGLEDIQKKLNVIFYNRKNFLERDISCSLNSLFIFTE